MGLEDGCARRAAKASVGPIAGVMLLVVAACGGSRADSGTSLWSLPYSDPTTSAAITPSATSTPTPDSTAPLTSQAGPGPSGLPVPPGANPAPPGPNPVLPGANPAPPGPNPVPPGPNPVPPAPGSGSITQPTQPPGNQGCGQAPSGTIGGKLAQEITFPKPANATFPGATIFHACSSSGLPVTYEVSGETCQQVGADGGSSDQAFTDCSVTASQPGNTQYAAAAVVTQTFRVDPIVVVLTLSNLKRSGDTATVDVTSSSPIKGRIVVGSKGSDCADGGGDLDNSTEVTVILQLNPASGGSCAVEATLSSAQAESGPSNSVTIPAQ